MAAIDKKKGKNGFVIQIRDLSLNTRLRTNISSKVEASVKLREINSRLDKVKADKSHEFYEWNKSEQREFAKYGTVPAKEIEQSQQPMTLKVALNSWIERLRSADKAESTIESYRRYIKRAIDFLGDAELENITTQNVQNFIDNYKNTPIKSGQHRGRLPLPESQKKHLNHLVMLWNHQIKYGVPNLDVSIFKPVAIGKRKATILDDLVLWDDFETRTKQLNKLEISPNATDAYKNIIFTKQQLQELRGYLKSKLWDVGNCKLKNKQLFAALVLCMFTGIRRSEIPRIRRQDLDFEYGEILILRMKGRKDKEFNRLRIICHPVAMKFIEQVVELLPSDQRSVFCDDDNHLRGESFTESTNRTKAETLSGRYRKVLQGSKWQNASGFHKYRHSLASILMAEGFTKEQVKETIGWSDDKMFERYKHLASSRQ
ncbi:tyrosine-type recombinase/integrase, partial [Mariniblastus sp.]|nr:tyrosine-type recombinase/integrase [Mariniblastus sp.]